VSITSEIKSARDTAERCIRALQRQAEKVLAELDDDIDAILSRHGKKRCPKCDATGAVERLDSGHMRKFGLREWNGCDKCGGDGKEKRGRGYVDK
jgi:hypothetical protein